MLVEAAKLAPRQAPALALIYENGNQNGNAIADPDFEMVKPAPRK